MMKLFDMRTAMASLTDVRTCMSGLANEFPNLKDLNASNPYTMARTLFAMIDQEIAFAVDAARKRRLAKPDATQLETAVKARLAAYENLTQIVGRGAQMPSVERSKEELRWVLQQLRR